MKIAHIINPVKVTEKSDLFLAQPVTFETMKKAKEFASLFDINIELFYTCYQEDLEIVPQGFKKADLLERSVLDTGEFNEKRKLPILRDIIDCLYNATDAEYLIYTNVDIALMPHFYVQVAKIIAEGIDAFVINRRTIDSQYTEVKDIPFMYSDMGIAHPGFDCFVFKRSAYQKYILGDICIGINWVGTVLLWNLQVFSNSFKLFDNLHLTFHIGDDRTWRDQKFKDYVLHNKTESKKVYLRLQEEDGDFSDERHWKLL